MEWQLIETAPKDGSRILVFYKTTSYIVQWKKGVDASNHNWEEREGWFMFEPDDEFYSASFLDYEEQPTHWMPLPNPPEKTNT